MANPHYGPAKKGACADAFTSILSSTVTDRTTYLCPYEQGFVGVKEKECCPSDLILYSWEMASQQPACSKEQFATPYPWAPDSTCNGSIKARITNGRSSLCYVGDKLIAC